MARIMQMHPERNKHLERKGVCCHRKLYVFLQQMRNHLDWLILRVFRKSLKPKCLISSSAMIKYQTEKMTRTASHTPMTWDKVSS